jgi:hypothetical protein
MGKVELDSRVKRYLSWALAIPIYASIDVDVCVAELHPGDGQYDCLSFITPDGQNVFEINRNGEATTAGEVSIDNVFYRAAIDPYEAALHILAESEMPVNLDILEKRLPTIQAMTNIANWLNLNLGKNSEALCGWIDNNYGAVANVIVNQFHIPSAWAGANPPYSGADWRAWLWALTIDENPIALVNLQTGEAINPDGSVWQGWPKHFAHPAGIPFPHFGFLVTAKDQNGGMAFENVVHVAHFRRVYKNLSEELFEMSKEPTFKFTNEAGAIEFWNDLAAG